MRYHETPVTVRFNEVDIYQVAWHGHYVSWMELGRNDLAGRFELNAVQIVAAGFLAPVVALEVQFKKPLRFAEEARVLTTLRHSATATLEFHCRILGADGAVAATGKTVHALTDLNGVLQYSLPPVIAGRLERLMIHLEAE